MNKFAAITQYYFEKAYRTAVWAFMDECYLSGIDCNFLGIKAQVVLTDCANLLGWGK
jgi:hypothetical protein